MGLTEDLFRREARRQAAVLAACQGTLPSALAQQARLHTCGAGIPDEWRHAGLATDAAGLRAYQGHARALAARLLRAAYPTLAAMLGDEALAALAVALWRDDPPASGDLGDWGAALPGLIAAHPELRAWPWLADSARLDWARHVCARSADVVLDAASLARLGSDEPACLALRLAPGLSVVDSAWPIARLHEAHRLPPHERTRAAEAALADQGHETVVVWKPALADDDGTVRMASLPAGLTWWMTRLWQAQSALRRAGHDAPAWPPQAGDGHGNGDGHGAKALQTGSRLSLDALLGEAPPDADFTAWLTQALREGWLWRVQQLPAAGGRSTPNQDQKSSGR